MSNPTLQAIEIADSWGVGLPLDYATGGGIAKALFEKVLGLSNWASVAKAGDSSEELLSFPMVTEIRKNLPGKQLALISMGGDDFAGPQCRLWFNQNTGQGIDLSINEDAFSVCLNMVIEMYKNLTTIRDQLAPNCLLLTHSYAPTPASMMGVGVGVGELYFIGPWLKPGLVDCGWVNPDDQEKIVAQMLFLFNMKLASFASKNRLHLHVDTQNRPGGFEHANELHLTTKGCLDFAQVLNTQLLPWLDKI